MGIRLLILGMMLVLWGRERSPTITIPPTAEAIALESAAFEANQPIPVQYTCDGGGNISPLLAWSGIPDTAQSLVLILDLEAGASSLKFLGPLINLLSVLVASQGFMQRPIVNIANFIISQRTGCRGLVVENLL